MNNWSSRFYTAVVVGVLALAGCGGGGGGGAPAAPAPPPTGPSPTCTGAEAFSAVADTAAVIDKAAGAVVAGCTGPITNIVWTQTGGPTVALLSAKTQAISFEPPTAGNYTFSVSFDDATGVRRTANVSTVAAAAATPFVVHARADQAVRKGGRASLRAWPPAAAGESITWTQTAGPLAVIDTTNQDQNRLLFTAPDVARDTALVFRVTKRGPSGETDSDDVLVLVENYAQAPADPAGTGPYAFSDSHVSRVYPYRAGGPFARALVRCTYEANLQYSGPGANLCPLSTLPFLHQTTGGAVPTVSQIMDRVVVSHDWMGRAFEDFLTTQLSGNDDLKLLFNGVTAIVIGAHVRPSFYYALTGAIYLDADNFWLTAEQRDVIDETPDFRSDFDRDLNYSTAWRYTSTTGGTTQSIFVNFPATSRIARDQSYLLAESGWLLYHELGHASDFLPPAARGGLNSSLSAWDNIAPRYGDGLNCDDFLPSDLLCSAFPLQSQEMLGLARVKYSGATASDVQRTYTATQVGAFFAPDRATDDYNYTTIREDIAMVFEEFMMARNHQWRRDVAFTDKINSATIGSSLTVRWGQRGRVGEANVKPRVQFVVGQLAPWVLAADPNAVQNLPPPLQMRAGDSWTGNLALPAPLAGKAGIQALRLTPLEFGAERAMLLRDVSRHHDGSPNDRIVQRLRR
jgi:hypothetical protein